MESKKTVAIVSLLTILLAFFALVPPASYANPGERKARYYIMGGTLEACTQLDLFPETFWITPFQTRPPYLTPLLMTVNVTATDPWFSASNNGWIVNLTIPGAAFVGVYHAWYDTSSGLWYNLHHYLPTDGNGWIFLNQTGDVDTCTFNNNTAAYWGRKNATFASPLEGQLASVSGDLPGVGLDGVPGTGDDGFGDGKKDPPGSSIVILPSWLRCEWATNTSSFSTLFDVSWPVVFTTGTAYDIVDESDSKIDGANATRSGQPQEFYAGLDHPEYPHAEWGTPYCDAYVKYACCWSMLHIWTDDFGDLDVMFAITYRLMRDDCVLPDIKGEDELITIFDIRRAAKAYNQYDESYPSKPISDPLFDAAADMKDPRGYIDIFDIRRVAKDYNKKLTPNGIIMI